MAVYGVSESQAIVRTLIDYLVSDDRRSWQDRGTLRSNAIAVPLSTLLGDEVGASYVADRDDAFLWFDLHLEALP